MKDNSNNTVLTITGSDSTSGSGVQADIITITSLGGNAVSAITSITVQNTIGIQSFYDIPADTVAGQIEAIVNDVQPRVVKIGMLRNAETVCRVAEMLRKYGVNQIICDPVIVSTHGDMLMSKSVVEEVKEQLLPLCSLVTMKQSSAEHIVGKTILTSQDMLDAAQELLSFGCKAVLLQGKNTVEGSTTDVLVQQTTSETRYFSSLSANYISLERHGISGNLSSAIATFLCKGHGITEAVELAYDYINQLFESHTGLVGRASELYNEFVSDISAHHSTNRDVSFYAEKLNVSSRYLAQVTKRIANKTPKMIIDDYLCKEAERLLSNSDKTIQEVAYALGFCSQAHFTKFFRKLTTHTPSDFRRKSGHQDN